LIFISKRRSKQQEQGITGGKKALSFLAFSRGVVSLAHALRQCSCEKDVG
jgi:hypothetical protein